MNIKPIATAALIAATLMVGSAPANAQSYGAGSEPRHAKPGGQSCGDAQCVKDFIAACADAGPQYHVHAVGVRGGTELDCIDGDKEAKGAPGPQSCGDAQCVEDYILTCSEEGEGYPVTEVIPQEGGGYTVECIDDSYE